jgi:hypothetical protein
VIGGKTSCVWVWQGGDACGRCIQKLGRRMNGPPSIENMIRKVPCDDVCAQLVRKCKRDYPDSALDSKIST